MEVAINMSLHRLEFVIEEACLMWDCKRNGLITGALGLILEGDETWVSDPQSWMMTKGHRDRLKAWPLRSISC